MDRYYLYQHTRLDKDEIFYIGVGTNQDVKYYSRSKEKSNRNEIWNRIVAKTEYRIDILLESSDYSFILDKEIELIEVYGRIDMKTGTLANMTLGGEGVANVSQEVKDKRNAALTGLKRTEEFRANLSEARMGEGNPMFGKSQSEEFKKATSKRFKGQTHMLGYQHTEESIDKIRESRQGSKHWFSRKVIDTITGEEFDTCTAAAASIGMNRGYLSNMLSGKCNNKTNFKYI